MGLPPAELRDEREDRSCVLGLAREPAHHHPGVLAQRSREARAREEQRRVTVVLGRSPGHDLLERNGELVRVERAALAYFFARSRDLVPGLHADPPYGHFMRSNSIFTG